MSEKRLLALIALLIGLVGALLILTDALNGLRDGGDLLSALGFYLVSLILGVAILLASFLIYRGKYGSGGILNILLGVVALILRTDSTGAILAIVAGVVGLIAAEAGP